MSSIITPGLAIAASILTGCGGAASAPSTTPGATEGAGTRRDLAAEVAAAAEEFDKAQLEHDAATISRYLADDFIFVRGSGRKTDRTDFLATFSDTSTVFEPFIIEDRVYITLGDAAVIVTAKGTMKGVEAGAPFEEHFRYADVYLWRDGRWQVVYVQVTPLKAPAPAP